ncbi:hypothetical protein TBR22_A22980 [Luteitalea sp. TBR-22]|uniref:hypothetical protein n=1 Tax=Luteitalea sp. TBR-22 TaxID=2802971 RepID=UPI001AF75E37|nr:hypothetical protein [Luteitalea sp. TBR-22]BCS33072.1 hypothetical protein TBR22_A22980 [Luteitalea sp. TBR-22]
MPPRFSHSILATALVALVAAPTQAATLTAGVVFGADSTGNTYPGWTWNTLGQQDDPPVPASSPYDTRNVWNLYLSGTVAPAPPAFINGYNDARTNISVDLAPGTYTFGLYGDSTGADIHPAQHFGLSLYFGGDTTTPGISGLTGPSCALCPAGNANATNLFGDTGSQGANSLTWTDGLVRVTLTDFSWALSRQDTVWAHYHNTPQYPNGNGRLDFVGALTLNVEAIRDVPEPAALTLLGLALLPAVRRHTRR